jgi:hypothetical protein
MATCSFLKSSQSLKLEDATVTNGLLLQNETVPPVTDGTLLIEQILATFVQKSSEFRLFSKKERFCCEPALNRNSERIPRSLLRG